VDPGAGWFPHYAGYAAERGRDDGAGANRNLPLAPGIGDEGWLGAVSALCADAAAHHPDAVVMSLGLDAAESDPESPLQVSDEGYRRAAREIAALGPTVVIQEGGYDLAALGSLAVAALSGAALAGAADT
jgi:acetoin utilization deacetylase AcuC-like enzyme